MLDSYTVKDAADILGLSTKTIYGYLKSGKLKAVKIGAFWRIRAEELERFLAEGATVAEENRRPANRGKT